MESILGVSGPLFQRPGAAFVACRFPVFFGWFAGPPKILSRGEVDDDLRGIRAQLTSYNKVQETKYRTTRYRIPNTVGCPQDQQSLYGKGIGNRIRAPAWGTQGMFYTCSI